MKILFSFLLCINVLIASIDLRSKSIEIYDVEKNIAKIAIGNLKIGQSGVIVHNDSIYESLIIAIGYVVETNNKYSTIKIEKKSIIKQDAIPISKLMPIDNDKFILNHLYQTSLLIVPNYSTKKEVIKKYKSQTFLSEDFFASYLKLIDKPIPDIEIIKDFCKSQQIGTVFIAIQNSLFIVDANTFKVIDQVILDVSDISVKVPFYSKIEKIEKGFWDIGADKIKNYDKHYFKLLGVK